MRSFRKKPKLSVVIAFFNMRREAARTLYSLTTDYQRDIGIDDYEVIVLDSGSRSFRRALGKKSAEEFQVSIYRIKVADTLSSAK